MNKSMIDGIIPEPTGGAHTNYHEVFTNVKTEINKHLSKLGKIKPEKRIEMRIDKFSSMGSIIQD